MKKKNYHGLDYEFHDEDGVLWRSSPLFICGPYGGGSSVAAANIRYIEKHHANRTWWSYIPVGWGGTGIGFNLPHVPRKYISTLDYLHEQYPCLDDELVSIIEDEWLEEAVNSWAMSDVAHNLGLDDYDEEKLAGAIIDACYGEGCGRWHHPEYDAMWIDVNNEEFLEKVKEKYDEGTE